VFRKLSTAAVFFVVGAAAYVSLNECTQHTVNAAELPATGYKLGDVVTDFALPLVGSGDFKLADQKGKVVAVVFWSDRCPFVVAWNDRIQGLFDRYKGNKAVSLVAIDSNAPNSAEDIKAFLTKKGLTFPVAKDAGNKVADQFGATNTPHVFIVGKDGKVAYIGALDSDMDNAKTATPYVKNAIEALLAGKPVAETMTKPVGCSVKRAAK
jgi:peroxiredoxin